MKARSKIIIAIAIAVLAIAIYIHSASFEAASASNVQLGPGSIAPNQPFYFLNGSKGSISSLRGKTVLLYLVTTWCSTCAQGTLAISKNMGFFARKNVTVLEVETYNDFNYTGMPISQFISEFALSNASKIIPAVSSYNFTIAYDPKGYLDIYYLITPSGRIAYVNGEPSVTMPELISAINSNMVQ